MAACPSCLFGAVASKTLSLVPDLIATVTVYSFPTVTVYPDGISVTSYENITSGFLEPPSSGTRTTYSDVNQITWTVGDATLTYPTVYIQYEAFKGATAPAGISATSCAQSATKVELPTNTDVASFIYPSPSIASMPLPTALLDYLGSLDSIASQFGGDDLANCAPLTAAPVSGGCGSEQQQQPLGNGPAQLKNPTGSTRSIFSNSTTAISRSSTSIQSCSIIAGSMEASSAPAASSLPPPGSPATTSPTSSPTSLPHNPAHHHDLTSSGPVYTHHTAIGLTTITLKPVVVHKPTPPTAPQRPQTTHADQQSGKPHTGSPHHLVPTPSPSNHPGTLHHHGPAPSSPSQPDSPHNPGSTPSSPNHPDTPHDHGHTAPVPNNPGITDNHSPSPPRTGSSVYSFGHTTVPVQSGGGVVVGHHTLHPNQPVTVGSGASRTTYALQTHSGTTHLVVDGSTYRPQPAGGATGSPENPTAVITANGHTITAVRSGSSIVVESGHSRTTVGAGSAITFGGQTISAPRSGSSVIVNGKPTTLSNPTGTATEAVVTTNGHTFTAFHESGSMVIAGASSTVTVKDGSSVTFDGQTVSAGQKGSSVAVNGHTVKVTPTTGVVTPSLATGSHSTAQGRPDLLQTRSLWFAVGLLTLLPIIL